MARFTQRHARVIAQKLDCNWREGRGHTLAELVHDGVMIASFGIRRGSKEEGHDYIPRDLHLQRKECWDLHDCALTKEGYLQLMRERGFLR
jgi:hypothetical protein